MSLYITNEFIYNILAYFLREVVPVPENNVNISIVSVHLLPDGTRERTEQSPDGLLRREDGAWVLSWWEGEGSGLGDTRSTLRLEGDRAELLRTGQFRSRMVFRVDKPHSTGYQTPYGTLSLTVRARRVCWEMVETGGTVELTYDMELDGGPAGETALRLTVRKKERT